jgi:hypothetical protein
VLLYGPDDMSDRLRDVDDGEHLALSTSCCCHTPSLCQPRLSSVCLNWQNSLVCVEYDLSSIPCLVSRSLSWNSRFSIRRWRRSRHVRWLMRFCSRRRWKIYQRRFMQCSFQMRSTYRVEIAVFVPVNISDLPRRRRDGTIRVTIATRQEAGLVH